MQTRTGDTQCRPAVASVQASLSRPRRQQAAGKHSRCLCFGKVKKRGLTHSSTHPQEPGADGSGTSGKRRRGRRTSLPGHVRASSPAWSWSEMGALCRGPAFPTGQGDIVTDKDVGRCALYEGTGEGPAGRVCGPGSSSCLLHHLSPLPGPEASSQLRSALVGFCDKGTCRSK